MRSICSTEVPISREFNPRGLPQQEVSEATLTEVSITPFPVYKSTSAEIVTATADVA